MYDKNNPYDEVNKFYDRYADGRKFKTVSRSLPTRPRSQGRLSLVKFIFPSAIYLKISPLGKLMSFAALVCLVALSVSLFAFLSSGLLLKDDIIGQSQVGFEKLLLSAEYLKRGDFSAARMEMEESKDSFSAASEKMDELGSAAVWVSRYIPFVSRVSSGKNAIEVGEHLSRAGAKSIAVIEMAERTSDPSQKGVPQIVPLEFLTIMEADVKEILAELEEAGRHADDINVDDLPSERRQQFIEFKNTLPSIISFVRGFTDNTYLLKDILGGNGPRKYLFLFQNNQEMRATGGFIGSYGLLDISEGRIRKFFIDGIFNPDGQLKDWIVPPRPIQKISANWSLHDSNWFPDFPVSAREAIFFYEKTGGPTVDGVITLTPTVMEKLLEITGPIGMPDYGVTLDAENFIAMTQYEVEVDYDRERNEPKKILADLAPLLLDRVFSTREAGTLLRMANVLIDSLEQKHILLYAHNNELLQRVISGQDWSGEIKTTAKDYLSVINTNINGYKTDGVIDESIIHRAEIQPDGSIVDTVTIRRHHAGGNSRYEWWNKVNANYLRVYVPLGSTLLEADGYTRETIEPKVDYDSLDFKRDPLVEHEERIAVVDPDSGTLIYEDAGKTVFANWAYVSPQETVTVRYKYLLPFKLDMELMLKEVASFSLLIQKQSGSLGSRFSSEVIFPRMFKLVWQSPQQLQLTENGVQWETDLQYDRFLGLALGSRQVISNEE